MPTHRAISQNELEVSLRDTLLNLEDALTRYSLEKESRYFKTICVNLRKLVNKGNGDNLIVRGGHDFRLYYVGDLNILDEFLSGTLESIAIYVDSVEMSTVNSLSFSEHRLRLCLYIRSDEGNKHAYSWLDIVKYVSDKFAVHTDSEVSRVYDELCEHTIGDMPAIEYLLVTYAEAILMQALPIIGIPAPIFPLRSMSIGGVILRSPAGQGMRIINRTREVV